jgi:peroxiredoxin
MNDDRLIALLRDYDRVVEPRVAFADQLYGVLAVELGFAVGRIPWWRRWTRRFALPQAGPLRYAFLLVMLALLLALAASVVLIGALFINQRSALDIVQESQTVYEHPPKFVMTVRFGQGGEERYSWDGTDALRIDVLESGAGFGEPPAGSFQIRTSSQQATYNAGDGSWNIGPAARPFPLWGLLLTWVPQTPIAQGEAPPQFNCESWQRGPDGTIAGRAAFEISCGAESFWVDRESLLLLRADHAFTAADQVVVTDLDLTPTFDSTAFSLAAPKGAHPPEEGPISTLAIGDPLPATTATSPEGTTFDFASLRGRPTAIYIWCSCTQGPQVRFFAQEAVRRANDMNLVLVAIAPSATVAGLIQLHNLHIPALVAGDTLLTDWQVQGFPALLLLDAQGQVTGYTGNFFSESDLAAILDAATAGQPIPAPAPNPNPGAPEGAVSTVLEPGVLAPDWTRPRLGGGQFSVSDTRGKPTAFYFWQPNDAGQTASVEGLVAAWAKRGDAISLVLVVGEEGPVLAKDVVEQHHWNVPVVYDWDGEASERWGLLYFGNLVALDPNGNVLTVLGQFGPDPEAILDALARGAPLPSPTIYPGKFE